MKEIIDEYDPQYCLSLEAAYGKGMMSDGGSEAIDLMFENIPITEKKALDIGSGLGGVACYLAKEYGMSVTGLEINPWMIQESIGRIPGNLQDRVRFLLSTDNNHLPFEDHSFDIIYSKGVLCHLEDKKGLFDECFRILKPGGVFVVNDWLSSKQGEWGGYVQRLVELEGLSLYAETKEGYLKLLKEAGFQKVEAKDIAEYHARYNEEIVYNLKTPEKKAEFVSSFGKRLHKEAIEGYDSIAKAIRTHEALVILFTACK